MTEWEIPLEAVQPALPFRQGDDLNVAKATSITNAGTVLLQFTKELVHMPSWWGVAPTPQVITKILTSQTSSMRGVGSCPGPQTLRMTDSEPCLGSGWRPMCLQCLLPRAGACAIINLHVWGTFVVLIGSSTCLEAGTPSSIQVSGFQPVCQDPFTKPLFPKIFTLQS